MANRTGKGTIKKGEIRNPGGLRKGARVEANDFRDWAFGVWKENKDDFKDLIISDQKVAMDFLKMLAGFVPKQVEVGNKDSEPFVVSWEK